MYVSVNFARETKRRPAGLNLNLFCGSRQFCFTDMADVDNARDDDRCFDAPSGRCCPGRTPRWSVFWRSCCCCVKSAPKSAFHRRQTQCPIFADLLSDAFYSFPLQFAIVIRLVLSYIFPSSTAVFGTAAFDHWQEFICFNPYPSPPVPPPVTNALFVLLPGCPIQGAFFTVWAQVFEAFCLSLYVHSFIRV